MKSFPIAIGPTAPLPIGSTVSEHSHRIVGNYRAALGEGPLWDYRSSRLIWCDILGGCLLVSDTEGTRTRELPFEEGITAIGLAEGNRYIATTHRRFVLLNADFSIIWSSDETEPDLPSNRFNDGKVDPLGRFWAGTMEQECRGRDGSFYLFDQTGVHELDAGYGCTNGPAFSPDSYWAFFTDSNDRTIYRCPLEASQTLDRSEPFIQFQDSEGVPDGMTFDTLGRLYVAHFDGGQISRYTPDGVRDAVFPLPARNITSLTFGRDDGATAFATSAHCTLDETQRAQRPDEGALFALDLGAKGANQPIFRIPEGVIQ